jgi:hypothetical protein
LHLHRLHSSADTRATGSLTVTRRGAHQRKEKCGRMLSQGSSARNGCRRSLFRVWRQQIGPLTHSSSDSTRHCSRSSNRGGSGAAPRTFSCCCYPLHIKPPLSSNNTHRPPLQSVPRPRPRPRPRLQQPQRHPAQSQRRLVHIQTNLHRPAKPTTNIILQRRFYATATKAMAETKWPAAHVRNTFLKFFEERNHTIGK